MKKIEVILNGTKRLFINDTFNDPSQHKAIMAEMPDIERYRRAKAKTQEEYIDAPVVRPCYCEPLLTKEQELHLFRKYNFLKFKARTNALEEKLNKASHYWKQALEIREIVALANVRLVRSILRKKNCIHDDDLTSEGYLLIVKTCDYFNWTLGFKFCTYATWAVHRKLMQCFKEAQQKREQERVHFAVGPSIIDLKVADQMVFDIEGENNKRYIEKLLGIATEREQAIIRLRFGLDGPPKTLEECGRIYHLTRERIRQIETQGLFRIKQRLSQAQAQA